MTTDEIAAALEAILATTASEHVRVHVRNISALLSERKAMREEIERLQIGGWRPIETAPKDETFIDIWSSRHGRLTDYWRVARSSENVFYTTDVGFTCVRDASHWMPIPSQPDITEVTK